MWYNNGDRNIKNYLAITVSSLLPPIIRSDVNATRLLITCRSGDLIYYFSELQDALWSLN